MKYTEQEQVMAVGDGFWKTVTGRGSYNHYFADPVAGQVGWMGTMREKGGLLLMSVRLRVQLGRITEIENVVLPGRRRRAEQHRRDGQSGTAGGALAAADSAGAARVTRSS